MHSRLYLLSSRYVCLGNLIFLTQKLIAAQEQKKKKQKQEEMKKSRTKSPNGLWTQ